MNNQRILRSTIAFILLVFTISSCIKQEEYPIEPQIAYQSFLIGFDTSDYATVGVLNISFTDGDGDIGLSAKDTNFPYERGGDYYYNYVLTFFNKVNGVYQEVPLDPPFSVRIPILNPDSPNKAIKGTIADTINLQLIPHPGYDTIRFEGYIYDRRLHKSNTITTPDIILKRPY